MMPDEDETTEAPEPAIEVPVGKNYAEAVAEQSPPEDPEDDDSDDGDDDDLEDEDDEDEDDDE